MSNTSNQNTTSGKSAPAANAEPGTDKNQRQPTVVEPSKAGAATPSSEQPEAISASPQVDQGTGAAQPPAKIDEPAKH